MYIGIDLGGTNIAVGLVNEEGKLLETLKRPTLVERGLEPIVKDMVEMAQALMNSAQSNGGSVKAVGVGVPGVVDAKLAHVYYCTNLYWNNVPLKRDMERQLSVPVYVDNDANLAALAEYKIGALKDTENSILLTLGTGVGGGLILNGKPYRGSYGLGSEVGHIVIGENFYNCACGKNGCFETFASATALIKHTQKYLSDHPEEDSVLRKRDILKLSAQDVVDAARGKDAVALKTYNRFVDYLSLGIVNIINLLDPERIAIGGGVALAGDFLFEPLQQKIEEASFVKEIPHAQVVPAITGNDAGIIGAALLGQLMS